MFETTPATQIEGGPTLAAVAAMLDSIPVESYDELAPAAQIGACGVLGRLGSRLRAHQIAAARALEKSHAAETVGATSTGALLANTFGGDPGAAKRLLGQARRLEPVAATTGALGRGEVTMAQAELIARTVKDLPGDPTLEQREACEAQLLGEASDLTLKDLARRADRASVTYAPEDVDAHEDKILHDREEAAWKAAYFWMADRKDGTFKGEFVIPEGRDVEERP